MGGTPPLLPDWFRCGLRLPQPSWACQWLQSVNSRAPLRSWALTAGATGALGRAERPRTDFSARTLRGRSGDDGTITGAAAHLHISQPALSRTLDQLEKRLGVRLVERTTRRLELTAAGKRLFENAHRILGQLDDALADAAGENRPLRIGFAWAALGHRTVPTLKGWREEHPATPVQMLRYDDPEAALRRGDVDVALLRTLPPRDEGFDSLALYREKRLMAVAESDPLAQRGDVRLAELATRPVVLCDTAATASADLWPPHQRPRTLNVANVDEWITLVATGEAIGVTTEGTAHGHPHPGVRYVPLTDASEVTVHLTWPRLASHAATEAFLRHAQLLSVDQPPG